MMEMRTYFQTIHEVHLSLFSKLHQQLKISCGLEIILRQVSQLKTLFLFHTFCNADLQIIAIYKCC